MKQNKVRKILVTVATATLLPVAAWAQQRADSPADVMKIVATTTAEICGAVPIGGWDARASAESSLQASLKGFFRKLADGKLVGITSVGGGAYEGPLQVEITKARADSLNCRKDVSARLLDYVNKVKESERTSTGVHFRAPARAPSTRPRTEAGPSVITGASGSQSPVIADVSNSTISINNYGSPVPAKRTSRMPTESAEEFAARFLHLIDVGDIPTARILYEPSLVLLRSEAQMVKDHSGIPSRYYPARRRQVAYSVFLPAATYQLRRDAWGVYFKTTYKNGTEAGTGPNESVGLVLSDNGEWQVVELHCMPCETAIDRAQATSSVHLRPEIEASAERAHTLSDSLAEAARQVK
ncbi:hypothetical protein [Cupriavidus sp. AcVe19-6a]|uniref:hypothetical protein n=1 Tax=Cupriavidus sp. AcVe19-6a TaxID=2821358 RepID=UPI001AE4AFE3|nr:hypothetical protein [Cupriavidus sp. AcVe19-6a]MBP0639958.1 hypothetical protein [Cupriavidus sp. AcVe19-6a]